MISVSGLRYVDAVAWAAEQGIVNGVSETSFASDSPIMREELATILMRFCESVEYDAAA